MHPKTIILPIAPQPKRRPRTRVLKTSGGPRAIVYQDAKTRRYEDDVAMLLRAHRPRVPWTGGVKVDVCFYLRRPKRLKAGDSEIHAVRPDLDNLVKSLAESLTKCNWVADDSQLCDLRATKRYAGAGEEARIELCVEEVLL